MSINKTKQLVVIGGGAAGFFAAISCAEADPGCRVIILEKGKKVLQKVKVSGGGRCNVTHACFDPRELVKNYPRGGKALLGPFNRFAPDGTVAWFYDRGVPLKTESDGRMFPVSNDSQTIVACLLRAARQAGVKVLTGQNVAAISKDKQWEIRTQSGAVFMADKVLVATGSSPRIWKILEKLGHHIIRPVPSLFTFNIEDQRIKGLAGIAVPRAEVKVLGEKLAAEGPLLITHWGMSGPAVLKLSAWGARLLNAKDYAFEISINWLGNGNTSAVFDFLKKTKMEQAKKRVANFNPFPTLPKRLWERLLFASAIDRNLRWADLPKKKSNKLGQQLTGGIFKVNGKSTFKEEFVTAGGVDLDEIDFRKFESKILPGLHLAGEVLNIDALTGGFNFQAAWTGGKIAGEAMFND
ncbi:MAG TPA: NAD(P)/FAD-dependent oxidoreductase [Bacteroidetes bacterium]|nr:NAD(P)/FAD-dependent oxidoreductase [Bacteroidota bacterium]